MKNGRFITLFLFVNVFNVVFAQNNLQIDFPKSGWRNSSGQNLQFTQSVHYPASSVNVSSNQSAYALIKGNIKFKQKEKKMKPHTLVVNGISMPLLTNDNGSFARPYLFGPGSNQVEIIDPQGKERKRVQFFEANTLSKNPSLSVILSWDTNQTDLDLHVVSPDGEHTYYGNRISKNGSALDVDVTTGYGPEIYSTTKSIQGTYLIYANYYGSGVNKQLTVATVTVVTKQNTLDEKVQTLVTALRRPGDLNYVYSFQVK